MEIFKENKYSAFSVALRIGIQGAEVTSYLTTDPITIHYSDRTGHNTFTFTLQNAYDNFVITEDNLKGIWRGEKAATYGMQPHYSEIPKKLIYDYKQKKMNLKSTNKVRTEFVTKLTDEELKGSDPNNPADIKTYNFKPGTIIFNKNDPVRIFMHNPLKEYYGKDKGEWIPLFTGFINNKPKPTDYINGTSTITISCYCIKAQLDNMRTCFTPIVKYTEEMINSLIYDTEGAGFYRDFIWGKNEGIFQNPFTNRNFHDSISVLLLGDESLAPENQGSRSRVGFFRRGTTLRGTKPNFLARSEYDPTTKNEINVKVGLENSLLDPTIAAETERATFEYLANQLPEEKQKIKFAKMIEEAQYNKYVKDDPSSPLKEPMANILVKYSIEQPKPTLEFTSDYKQQITKAIAYAYDKMEEQKGDYSLEYWHTLLTFGDRQYEGESVPYYTSKEVTIILARTVTFDEEFSPWAAKIHMLLPPANKELTKLLDEVIKEVRSEREFTTRYQAIFQLCDLIDFQWITTPMGDIAFEFPMYDYMPYDFGPTWENVFIVDKFAVSDTIDTESGEIISALIVSAGIDTLVSNSAGEAAPEGYFDKIVIKSDVLAGKYGAKFETWTAPIGKQVSKGVKNTNLRVVGLIEFQKRLAAMDSATVDFVYHPFLLPNRNIMWEKGKKLLWANSVEYTISLFKDITNTVDVAFVTDYEIKENEQGKKYLSYNYIFGGAMMPLSFKDIENSSLLETNLKGNYGIHVIYDTQEERSKKEKDQKDSVEKAIVDGTGIVPNYGLTYKGPIPHDDEPVMTAEQLKDYKRKERKRIIEEFSKREPVAYSPKI